MTEHQTIDDVFVPENMDYGSIIRCDYCGFSGLMFSTHEPNGDQQYWDCDGCGRDDVSHEIVMATDSVEELKDAAGSGGKGDGS